MPWPGGHPVPASCAGGWHLERRRGRGSRRCRDRAEESARAGGGIQARRCIRKPWLQVWASCSRLLLPPIRFEQASNRIPCLRQRCLRVFLTSPARLELWPHIIALASLRDTDERRVDASRVWRGPSRTLEPSQSVQCHAHQFGHGRAFNLGVAETRQRSISRQVFMLKLCAAEIPEQYVRWHKLPKILLI